MSQPRPGVALTADPGWLALLAQLSRGLNRLAAALSALLLVLMTLLILVEIGMRFFGRSTFMADILVGYGVAAITFLAAAWALEQGSMIRVSVLTDRMRPRLRRATEAFCLISTGALILFLIRYQGSSVLRLWSRGSTNDTYYPVPLWIPESFFLTGLVLIALQILLRLCRLAAVGHAEDRALTL